MPLADRDTISEHVLEVRHRAFGGLLDIRGRVADAIADEKQFTAWRITDNRIEFRPTEEDEHEAAFVSHRNIGYLVRGPDTRNYFHDKAMKFIRSLLRIEGYTLREVLRFGYRSRFLIPSREAFKTLVQKVDTRMPMPTQFTKIFDAQIDDYGPVVVLRKGDTKIRVQCGPMEKEQAKTLLEKEKDRLPEVGFYLDIDHYRVDLGEMDERKIGALLQTYSNAAWAAADAYNDILL